MNKTVKTNKKSLVRASVANAALVGIKRISTASQLPTAINKIMNGCDMPYFNKINVAVDLDEMDKLQ